MECAHKKRDSAIAFWDEGKKGIRRGKKKERSAERKRNIRMREPPVNWKLDHRAAYFGFSFSFS
jgi:hypothetical protein